MVGQVTFSLSDSEMVDRERFTVAENLPKIGQYYEGKRQASAREFELHDLYSVLSLHHFGVSPTKPQCEIVATACRLTYEFFTQDWWQAHERDRGCMRRDEDNKGLEWLEPYRLGLLFAGLAQDQALLKALAEWPRSWMVAEWRAVPFPDGLEQLYFAMLTSTGFADLLADGHKIQNPRIELLLKGVRNPTEQCLSVTLNDSLALFAAGLTGKEVLPYEAIALEETIICLLWQLASLDDPSSAIRPELQTHILRLVE